MKRTLTDYTIEELQKALEQNPKGEHSTQEYETDVPMFLSFYKIQPGKDPVNKRLLFKLYGYYSENPVTSTRFAEQLNLYIPFTKSGTQLLYHINRKALDISQEAYKFILKHSHDRIKVPAWKAHFDKFITHYKLKSGDYYLEGYILHNLYDKFTYETNKKYNLGYIQFLKFCELYFDKQRLTSDKVSYYGVDKSIREFITDDELKQLRESKNPNGKETNETV